jgi:hypothetical protein
MNRAFRCESGLKKYSSCHKPLKTMVNGLTAKRYFELGTQLAWDSAVRANHDSGDKHHF